MVEPRRNMGCSLIGPARWRGRGGGSRARKRKRGDRHKREVNKRRRKDWTLVCLAARVYEEAVAYAFVHRDM